MDQVKVMDYSNTSEELYDWFGLTSPTFMIVVIAVYLLLIYKCLPSYMKNRKPYNLKTFISVYNVCQVIACMYVISKINDITSLRIFKFWKCKLLLPNTRAEYDFNRLIYFVFWLKLTELSETIVFVLRKKQNQVSLLHVFHHSTTISLIYILGKYYNGGSGLYPLLLNSIVHVFMYSYYFAAAVCDKRIVRRLLPIKKFITAIQMIQFTMILSHAVALTIFCDISLAIVMYYSFVIGAIFYGFYDFYQKSYTTNKKHTHSRSKVTGR